MSIYGYGTAKRIPAEDVVVVWPDSPASLTTPRPQGDPVAAAGEIVDQYARRIGLAS